MEFDPRALRKIGRYPVRRWVSEGPRHWLFEVDDPQFFGERRVLRLYNPEGVDAVPID